MAVVVGVLGLTCVKGPATRFAMDHIVAKLPRKATSLGKSPAKHELLLKTLFLHRIYCVARPAWDKSKPLTRANPTLHSLNIQYYFINNPLDPIILNKLKTLKTIKSQCFKIKCKRFYDQTFPICEHAWPSTSDHLLGQSELVQGLVISAMYR